jgi:hypothetical protein
MERDPLDFEQAATPAKLGGTVVGIGAADLGKEWALGRQFA